MKRQITTILTIGMLSSVAAATLIEHEQLDYVEPEKRIGLSVKLLDTEGINTARTYFKAKQSSDYVFIDMQCKSQEAQKVCTSVLPAPLATTESIDYVFLVENGKKEITKSQTFSVPVKKDVPTWKKAKQALDTASDIKDALKLAEKILKVNSELAEISQTISGFGDQILVQAVELKEKLGVVSGLTSSSSAGTTTTAASTASGTTSAGTITATTAGISTTTMVVVGAGAVAVGAAAAGGSSDSGSSFSCATNETTYQGPYSGTCNQSGTVTFCYDVADQQISINYKGVTDGPTSFNGSYWSGTLTDGTYLNGTLSNDIISGNWSYVEGDYDGEHEYCSGTFSADKVVTTTNEYNMVGIFTNYPIEACNTVIDSLSGETDVVVSAGGYSDCSSYGLSTTSTTNVDYDYAPDLSTITETSPQCIIFNFPTAPDTTTCVIKTN